MSDFAVGVAADDHALTLAVTGALDIATADRLWETGHQAINESGAMTVLVDLADTDFLDSSGVSALVRLRKHAAASGARLQVVNPRPTARRVLELSGLDDLLQLD